MRQCGSSEDPFHHENILNNDDSPLLAHNLDPVLLDDGDSSIKVISTLSACGLHASEVAVTWAHTVSSNYDHQMEEHVRPWGHFSLVL